MILPDVIAVATGAVFGACLRAQVAEVASKRSFGPWHIAGRFICASTASSFVLQHLPQLTLAYYVLWHVQALTLSGAAFLAWWPRTRQ